MFNARFFAAEGDGLIIAATNLHREPDGLITWQTLFRVAAREVVDILADDAEQLVWTDTQGTKWTFRPLTLELYNTKVRRPADRQYLTQAALERALAEAFALVH